MLDKVRGSDSISLRLPNQALFFTNIFLPREYRGEGRRLPVNGDAETKNLELRMQLEVVYGEIEKSQRRLSSKNCLCT
jgi:hypothetical protein